jgi:hypothetical protein
MKILIPLYIFISVATAATLPKSTANLSTIIQGFRPKFQTMISNLKINYIYDISKNHIKFTSSDKLKCGRTNFPKGSTLARITYNVVQTESKLTETVSYFGCGDTLYLIEEVITIGPKAKPVGMAKIANGELDLSMKIPSEEDSSIDDFSIENNHTKKSYSLRDSNNGMIFQSVEKIISPTKKSLSIFLFNFNILQQIINKEESRITASQFYRFKSFKYNFGRMAFDFDFPDMTIPISIVVGDKIPLIIMEQNINRISEQEMLEGFNQHFINGPISAPKRILDVFVSYLFPKTEFVSSGGNNDRFLNELQRLKIQLDTPSTVNLSLARRKLIQLIESLRKGLITVKDNREN